MFCVAVDQYGISWGSSTQTSQRSRTKRLTHRDPAQNQSPPASFSVELTAIWSHGNLITMVTHHSNCITMLNSRSNVDKFNQLAASVHRWADVAQSSTVTHTDTSGQCVSGGCAMATSGSPTIEVEMKARGKEAFFSLFLCIKSLHIFSTDVFPRSFNVNT